MKTVMLEAGDSTRHNCVRSMFENVGFKVSVKKDFRNWLWVHFILNARMAAVALHVGGYKTMYDSSKHMKEAFLLMREMIPILRAKGGRHDRLKFNFFGGVNFFASGTEMR